MLNGEKYLDTISIFTFKIQDTKYSEITFQYIDKLYCLWDKN